MFFSKGDIQKFKKCHQLIGQQIGLMFCLFYMYNYLYIT